jgi:hypothetical protein
MWYRIRKRWLIWFTEWRITEVALDELLDIIDI